MTIRISTGTTVQTISIGVLWLQRAGVGFAFLLKRITHADQQPQHEQA